MKRFLLLALLVSPLLFGQDTDDYYSVYPPEGVSTAVGITPVFHDPLVEDRLEHYWPMDEATGATRVDRVGSNDFTVTTGPATQVAAHLGNGTNVATLTASSFTVGPDGYSVGWWQEAVNAGAPSLRAFYTFTGQGTQSVTASSGQSNIQTAINGRPGGVAKGHLFAAPYNPEFWHFIVIVVDSAGVTSYQGDDTGTALDEQFDAWDSGDSFVAPTGYSLDFSTFTGLTLDDMFQYSRPLTSADVSNLYNAGAGNPLFP